MMFLQLLTFLVLGQLQGSHSAVTTTGDIFVLEGQSITVPCHYNPQYTSHVKYWCYGRMREFCTSLARTDSPESAPNAKGRVTITDDPTQHLFTVTMQELKVADSGWYRCGVEVGGMWVSDSTASLYISVTQGMSVQSNKVSAAEGGSVSIQCIYSSNLGSVDKKWCRSGDWSSCVVTEPNGTSSGRNVHLRDDGRSALTVTLRQLEMRDAGWYWCAAGQQQVAVQVSVTPRATTLSPVSPVQTVRSTPVFSPVLNTNDSHSHVLMSPLIVCGAVLLMMTVFLAVWTLRQQQKKKQKHQGTTELRNNLAVCWLKDSGYENKSAIFPKGLAEQ